EFKRALLEAVQDGKLTDAEIEQLGELRTTFGLTLEELRQLRIAAYEAAFRAASSDRAITDSEATELAKIQDFLQLKEADIGQTKKDFARYRLIAEIQAGNLPVVQVPTIILQKNEIAHWREPSSLIEERVVGRRYVGGSSGVSVRIARGVSYRVGSSRGRLMVDKADVPVSTGELVLTNKRVIFRGDRKSFNYRLDKLLDVQLYETGLLLTDSSGKPRVVHFATTGNSDIVGGILTHAINRFMEAAS
ncbi:MAG TPA: hypothetical protein VE110_03960, partial [Gemmatimonadaceae bacterium]|nr:hypothetical protein [Gemmatimonadaceae bacterium]